MDGSLVTAGISSVASLRTGLLQHCTTTYSQKSTCLAQCIQDTEFACSFYVLLVLLAELSAATSDTNTVTKEKCSQNSEDGSRLVLSSSPTSDMRWFRQDKHRHKTGVDSKWGSVSVRQSSGAWALPETAHWNESPLLPLCFKKKKKIFPKFS